MTIALPERWDDFEPKFQQAVIAVSLGEFTVDEAAWQLGIGERGVDDD